MPPIISLRLSKGQLALQQLAREEGRDHHNVAFLQEIVQSDGEEADQRGRWWLIVESSELFSVTFKYKLLGGHWSGL
jgi:hypothetical protein